MNRIARSLRTTFVAARRTWMTMATAGLLAGPTQAIAGRTPTLDCTPAAFPALIIQGDDVSRGPDGQPAAFRGFADPCIRRDLENGKLWMAYSWPHVEYRSANLRDALVGVETHLAASTDDGKTWQRVQVLWPKTPATYVDPTTSKPQAGFISHEVPNLVSCQIDGKPAWVGARLDYFLGPKNYRSRNNLSFCLRLMAASSPPLLAGAPYVTFGHNLSAPECAVDLNVCDLSPDFPDAFIPNEPALCWQDGRLYLAFVCMTFKGSTPDFPQSFIAIFSSVPQGEVRNWKWRYDGKLATHREAVELGGEALTQIELARGRDGRLLALLTPEAWDSRAAKAFGGDAFGGIMHRGCTVVEVASLDHPALARGKDGSLVVRSILISSTQPEQGPGAAGYDPASATGILFTLRELLSSKNLSWSLHPTGLHP